MKKLYTFIVFAAYVSVGYSQQQKQPVGTGMVNTRLADLNSNLEFYSKNYEEVFKNQRVTIDSYTADFYDIYKKETNGIFYHNYNTDYLITGMPKPGPNLNYNCNQYGSHDFTGAAVGIGIVTGIFTAIFTKE